jgi:hypothetical protein
MDWRRTGGKIPIYKLGSKIQIDLVGMPNKQYFDTLFGPQCRPHSVGRKWVAISYRSEGLTLEEVSEIMGLSSQRIRQIEDNFQRRLQHRYHMENR